MKKQAEYFIEKTTISPVTKKEFFRIQKEIATEGTTLKSILLKNKVFTPRQIEKLIDAEILHPIVYQSRTYFKHEEVVKGLKYFS